MPLGTFDDANLRVSTLSVDQADVLPNTEVANIVDYL